MSRLDDILKPFSDYGYHHEDGCRADCKNCKMLDNAKRQIEDFYRNKIPKKVAVVSKNNALHQATIEKVNGRKVTYEEMIIASATSEGYNQAIDAITAQFNSKGDSDE